MTTMTENSSTFFNGFNCCYCKTCIIAEAKKLENKNLYNDAVQVLNDAAAYHSQIIKELDDEKKALFSRLSENDRIQFEAIQSSRNLNKNKTDSTLSIRCHAPLNIICGKQKAQHGFSQRNPNDEFSCPVAVFESKSDSRLQPMYPKNLVYKDGRDVQLEEIRAALYWERVKKQGNHHANQPEKNILFTRGRTPSNEREKSSLEKFSAPQLEKIRKPLQDMSSENVADFMQQSETNNEPHDVINQIKPLVVSRITNSSRSPLQKRNTASTRRLDIVSKEINDPLPIKMNENLLTSRLPLRTTTPNYTINQTKPTEKSLHIGLPQKIKSCQNVVTNKKQRNENHENSVTTNQNIVQSSRANFPAADKKVFIEEQKSRVKEPVKDDACATFEPNQLRKNSAHPKFTDATFICHPVQKSSSIFEKTYVIENEPKSAGLKSESLNNKEQKTPKQCNNLDDISKLFEESCMINSAGTKQCTSKVLPSNNEDKENVLPIRMISSPWDEDDEDTTGETKAFAVILPSSTPNRRRSQFYSNGHFAEPKRSIGPRASIANTSTLNLSMIPETSRERSSSSSGAGSVTSVANSKNVIQDKPTLSAITETEEKSRSVYSNCDVSDPFDFELHDNLLERLQFPREYHQNGYHLSETDMSTIKLTNSYKLGLKKYTIAAEIGKGSYARVLKAFPTSQPNEQVALKIQKPACVWEYYISKEILNRLKSEDKLRYFLHYSDIFVFRNCSILLSEWGPYGSLLSFRNSLKTQNCGSQEKYPMAVGVYLSIQIISAVNYLHSCRIIHGDIKPDNFIISCVSSDGRPSIKLIDFGRSIDMTVFPENTVFHKVVKTEDFTCNEMRDGKAWTYQTDLFGMAGTFYVLLIGDYMKTIKKGNGLWVLKKPLARYMCRDQWDPIFMALLNVPSCNELPDLSELKTQLETFYDSFSSFEKKQQFNKILPIFKK